MSEFYMAGIVSKLARHGESGKRFLFKSKCCTQGVVCPCTTCILVYTSIHTYQVSDYRTKAHLISFPKSNITDHSKAVLLIWFSLVACFGVLFSPVCLDDI